MRVLAFNHFFDQDLHALKSVLEPGDELKVVGYQRLHRLARRHFDEAAFTGVASAYAPERETAWASYRPPARAATDKWAAAYAPDVFVTPTDAIFYLRPVIERFNELGCPTVVVQKETTISPMVMNDHARAVGASVPFMSQAMTVCSERQMQFWVKAGTDPASITVTGQPRFDVYRTRPAPSSGGRRILYLSYDDNAYLPSDTGEPYHATWAQLRRQTEEVLAALAGNGWTVVVKRHPQQSANRDWLGRHVRRADQAADTRQLILEADVVVGFQTTALFEAAAARRPVVYPAWGDVYEGALELLIPFHEWPQLASHACSPDSLAALLQDGPPSPSDQADALIEEYIGRVDGAASHRALAIVRSNAGSCRRPDVARPSPLLRPMLRAAAAATSAGVRVSRPIAPAAAQRAMGAVEILRSRADEVAALRGGDG